MNRRQFLKTAAAIPLLQAGCSHRLKPPAKHALPGWEPGAPRLTASSDGVTSPLDPERSDDWNVCEVIAWGNVGLHLLNGKVVLALTNPRSWQEDSGLSISSAKWKHVPGFHLDFCHFPFLQKKPAPIQFVELRPLRARPDS